MSGKVNVTCDAWQAGNTDGYFAVTGHWIEERTAAQWELKSGLIGFTRVSNAHNGERLGQALFKIFKRVSIEHKVSANYNVLSLSSLPYRSVTSLAIMHQTTQRCFKRWQHV